MLFYMQMRWNIENRITLDDVCDMEVKEATAAQETFKVVAMYKVAGQRRVIAIVEMDSARHPRPGDPRQAPVAGIPGV
jgi:muconolactone D-isomerase